jgi:parvulin-like peptidyl-prolyl isomerase
VVYYDALYQAVAAGYHRDNQAHHATFARLSAIAHKSNSDVTFAELATRYSEDAYALTGGDRGYIAFADMSEELAQAVRGLRAREVSGVLRGEQYYYIVQLQEDPPADATEVWLRQISLAINSDFTGPWREMQSRVNVRRLVRE